MSGEDRRSRRGGGRSLGPLPRPARTLAHDPVQGTLAVRDGLFDSFGEQLRPGKYKWGYHQGPSKPPSSYTDRPSEPQSTHLCNGLFCLWTAQVWGPCPSPCSCPADPCVRSGLGVYVRVRVHV